MIDKKKRKCNHIIGIYDNECSGTQRYRLVEIGYNDHLADDNDEDFERFQFCPKCGEKNETHK